MYRSQSIMFLGEGLGSSGCSEGGVGVSRPHEFYKGPVTPTDLAWTLCM